MSEASGDFSGADGDSFFRDPAGGLPGLWQSLVSPAVWIGEANWIWRTLCGAPGA
jgi:hypothetical protein